MLFGKYRFHTVLEEDVRLPIFKGSTFRGAFGKAFRKVTCAVRRQECPDCLLVERCLYARTFEAKPGKDRAATRPHPYLIEPPLEQDTFYPAGSEFDFNLALFGETTEYLPYYILALEQMGAFGIGRKPESRGPARFQVQDVRINGSSIYDPQQQKLSPNASPERLNLELPEDSAPGRLTVYLNSPLRMKYKNQLTDELPYFVLVKALLRRISMLFLHYGEGEPDIDFRSLVLRAKEVDIAESNLRWQEQKRYSGKQQTVMQFGGLVGSITYADVPSDMLPLFDLARKLHIGKQTTFGLGLIDYHWEPAA